MIFHESIRDLKYFTEPRFQNWVSEEFKFMKKYVFDNTDVLDVGSETGRIGFMLLDILGFRLKSLCLTDYTDQLVKKVNNFIKEKRSEIKVELRDVTNLDYKDSAFKTVLCLGGVLNVLYSENYGGKPDHNDKSEDENFYAAVNELLRVLSPDGYFIFEVEKQYLEKIELIVDSFKNLEIIEYSDIDCKGPPYVLCCIKKSHLDNEK
tara:strand:+ start:4721 stop:5341 length:621 start_codon:yes stop_codon:yes gene_type:complete